MNDTILNIHRYILVSGNGQMQMQIIFDECLGDQVVLQLLFGDIHRGGNVVRVVQDVIVHKRQPATPANVLLVFIVKLQVRHCGVEVSDVLAVLQLLLGWFRQAR